MIVSYLGGKSLLAKKIIPLIPEHKCYAEVFAGAAWIFFKKQPSEVEIINDINSDLTTLYRCVQHHLEEFCRTFKHQLISRDEYDRKLLENPESLTDIQRAARFYYLIRSTYGSKLDFNSFAVSSVKPPRINFLRLEEELSAAHIRLSRVWIENMDFKKFIPRFDREGTFFYIDPPYYNCENFYGKDIFSKEDFYVLRDLLLSVKGKFILSLNDVPEVREIYKDFHIHTVQTNYSISKATQKVNEVLIMNYTPPQPA